MTEKEKIQRKLKKYGLTAVNKNYQHYDGRVYPSKLSILFFNNGQCYKVGYYSIKDESKIFNQYEHYGK